MIVGNIPPGLYRTSRRPETQVRNFVRPFDDAAPDGRYIIQPPSMIWIVPVVNDDSLEAR
jgi:hypothetical protein